MLKKLFYLIVAIVISGCAFVKNDASNKEHYEKIAEAIVVWEIPPSIPIKYVSYISPESARKSLSDLISDLKSQSTLAIQSYLTQQGIKKSSKNRLVIKPIEGRVHAGEGVTLSVTMYNESNIKIWSIVIDSGKSAIDTNQTLINRFIEKIISELDRSGLTK